MTILKGFRNGTDRTVTPDQTVDRIRPLMPAMGITRLANITGLDCIGIPVMVACRPNARSLAVSQGKGLDLAAARASALMESVESYHAERIHQPLKLASYEELRYTHPVANIDLLPRARESRFHPNLRLLWIEGRNLLTESPMWVPYELVHMNYTQPAPSGEGCFLSSSNGLASGNHFLEAISHAICEVVERDAHAVSDLDGPEAEANRRIDLSTIDEPSCLKVLERYDRAGVDLAVFDMTSESGIPAFLAHIVDRTENRTRSLYACAGMGCHPTRHIALLRALTEAAQGRLTAIAGSRDDLLRAEYERTRDLDAVQQARLQIQGQGGREFRSVPNHDSDTFDDDVAWELERLKAMGISEVVAIDLTRSELGIPVVRVVIPGLESGRMHPKYVAGRRVKVRTRIPA
jgi:ribosomal protein S12 methylthiotransferase accessory factor